MLLLDRRETRRHPHSSWACGLVLTIPLGAAATAHAEPGAAVTAAPAVAAPPPCDDCFFDAAGVWRDASSAYDSLNDTGEPERLQAWIGIVAILGIGTVWYWIDDRNIADWDKPALKQRFTGEAWRMDNNWFPMNFVYHPWTGASHYAVSRASHLGAIESALNSTLGSSLWEYVLEFNEKISVNDMIVTPGAGISLGEFGHKLNWYLNSSPHPSAGKQALAWVLGPGVTLDRAINGAPPTRPVTLDRLGYSTAIWHDFRFSYSVGAVDDGRRDHPALHSYEARGTLVSIPGYLRPGRLQRFFSSADFTSLAMSIEQSSRGAGFRIDSDTAFLGWLVQDLGYGSQPKGYATVIGLHAGYDYATSHAAFHEDFSAVHFPSIGWDLHARGLGLSADLGLRAQLDFAGIGPPAYPLWKAAHPRTREKSILLKRQYYYAWGGSTDASTAVSVGPLRLSSELFLGAYDSIEGLDRTQHLVTDDVDVKDTLIEQTTRLEIQVPKSPIGFGGFVSRRIWHSRVGEIRKDLNITTVGARLTAEF
ncbi:MAG: DUF3943 domain-containing protein [Polyangiaceae bacterium]|nr:DUF3943 domain-containing protein [Polyangiaceae bacterium]